MLAWYRVFPGGSDSKKSACNAGELDAMSGLRRSPGEGHGYPLQYSYLANSMDRGAWWVTVHWVAESDMTEQPTHTVQYKCYTRNVIHRN